MVTTYGYGGNWVNCFLFKFRYFHHLCSWHSRFFFHQVLHFSFIAVCCALWSTNYNNLFIHRTHKSHSTCMQTSRIRIMNTLKYMFPHLTFALCILKKLYVLKDQSFSLQDGVNIIQGCMSFVAGW